MLRAVEKKVKEEHNKYLLRPFKTHEVKDGFSMHLDKSPGPNGMNPAYFQTYWDIVGKEVTSTCIKHLKEGIIPEVMNSAQIVLIPKKSKPDRILDLHPIALCNVLDIIIAKILAKY